MFDCLLKQYKADVFNTEAESNIWKVLKPYKTVFFIGMVVLGMVLSVVWKNNVCLSLCAILFVGIFIFLLFNQNKSEEPIILEEIDKPTAKARMKKMIECLQKPEFKIDVKDERQLDKLIERAKKERNVHNVWRCLKNLSLKIIKKTDGLIFPGIGSGFMLWERKGISQILLKYVSQQKKLSMNNIFPYFVLFIFVMVLLFRSSLREFFPSKKQILDSFISDVEDIKLFPDKVCSLINKNEE